MTQETAEQWLAIFKRDEPDGVFVISTHRPPYPKVLGDPRFQRGGKFGPPLRENPPRDWDAALLPAIDKQIEEGGGWASMKRLPGGEGYIWDLIERGVLEESDGFVRRTRGS